MSEPLEPSAPIDSAEPRELLILQDAQLGFYRAYYPKPDDVTWRPFDGKFYRVYKTDNPDGSVTMTDNHVCEDCWIDIPKYLDFPRGLVSPESDGDHGGNFPKHRKAFLEGKPATEAVQKLVCLECYLESYKRFYPGAKPPLLRSDTYEIKDHSKIEQPVTEAVYIGEPKP